MATVESMPIVRAADPSNVVPVFSCRPVPTVKAAVVVAVIVPEAPNATFTPLYVTLELVNDALAMLLSVLLAPLIVLLVRVSEPDSVAKVPELGSVTLVTPVAVNVMANAPAVAKFAAVVNVPAVVSAPPVETLPPSVMVYVLLFTPVPPLAGFKIPDSVTAPVVSVLGLKPVVPALNDVTPPVSENWFQPVLVKPSNC